MNSPQPSSLSGAEVGMMAMAEAALIAVVEVLRRRCDLAQTLRGLLATPVRAPAPAAMAYLSLAKYAAYRSVSERTVRYDVKKMEEGRHFHRAGRKGGRIVIRVPEADAWYAERSRSKAPASSIEQLAVDEVTRRRARVALKKRKEK